MSTVAERIRNLDWPVLGEALNQRGFATTPRILDDETCRDLKAAYHRENLFRKTVVMAKHNYGSGEYRYWAYPLPPLVARLRQEFFPFLAAIANHWSDLLKLEQRFPSDLETYLTQCREAGQSRPTPLMLRYGPGDFNRMHRDLYGAMHFPLQVVVLLDEPNTDFEGGEFVLVEQTPRSQSRAEVVPLRKGTAVIFAVNECPRMGVRGYRRLKLSHGVSQIRSGQRHTLGIIFHDAS